MNGRSRNLERDAWAERFKTPKWQRKLFTNALMCQLCLCRSDEARRLIMRDYPHPERRHNRATGVKRGRKPLKSETLSEITRLMELAERIA